MLSVSILHLIIQVICRHLLIQAFEDNVLDQLSDESEVGR